MKNIEEIKQQVDYNIAATDAQIKLCNTRLRKAGLPEIPEKYAEILMAANGYIHEDINVFGAGLSEDETWFSDIFAGNADHQKSDILILGIAENTHLIFNNSDETFKVIDNSFDDILVSSKEPLEVLEYFLQIY